VAPIQVSWCVVTWRCVDDGAGTYRKGSSLQRSATVRSGLAHTDWTAGMPAAAGRPARARGTTGAPMVSLCRPCCQQQLLLLVEHTGACMRAMKNTCERNWLFRSGFEAPPMQERYIAAPERGKAHPALCSPSAAAGMRDQSNHNNKGGPLFVGSAYKTSAHIAGCLWQLCHTVAMSQSVGWAPPALLLWKHCSAWRTRRLRHASAAHLAVHWASAYCTGAFQ
jgi:hypothetical protein